MKATNQQIIAAYKSTGNVWRAAKSLGMAGQSVWERLRALDYPMVSRAWSREEIAELRQLVPNCTLSDIAHQLGRPYAGVACMASRLKIVTRYGNRVKRKLPRGSGLNKQVIARLLSELQNWPGSIREFCRSRGLSIDVFAMAVQTHHPETWRTLAWQKGLDEQVCPECGVAYYPMTKKQKTCSRRCTANLKRNIAYFGGRRREAIGMNEGYCQLCAQPKKSLQAHHILGKENDPENAWLIALCFGCHQLVTIAANRKVLDSSDGWERFIELVLARRLAAQGGQFMGTHVAVDVEYLTESQLIDIGAIEEEKAG